MKNWVREFVAGLCSPLTGCLAIIAAIYIAIGYGVAHIYDWPINFHMQLYSSAMQWGTIWFVLGLVTWRAIYIMVAVRPHRLTISILKDLWRIYFSPRRLGQGIPVVLIFSFMFSVFTSYKIIIPEIVPFQYDELFADIDRMLHFGVDPWRILFPVFGTAMATTVVSFFYKTWFVAKFSVLYWQAFSMKRPRLRAQFFLTYLLMWIVNGTIFATLLSSAGPCFYGYVVDGENPYAPLMAFLQASNQILPVWDLFAQDFLWTTYTDKSVTLFSGISAMPSMHVSLAYLFALLGWSVGRKTGIFFTAYLAITMIGSVHLGWHYAIDGYFGIITTTAIWFGVGAVLKRRKFRAMAHQPEAHPVSSS